MATELGSAFISVGMGTNTLAGDIKKAFGGAESSGSSAGKSAGKGFGLGFAGIATGAIAALGIGTFLKGAVSGAADLEQSVGAIGSVFKESSGQMQEWSQQAAVDVGLSANEFNELGTLIGSQLKNGGTAMDELAPKTKALISTGADLASMFGGTTSEAVEALSSALKGERDPIERYGVSLNQAKIDAEAASLGFKKVNGAFEQSAQQAATLSLITKQTADATGNFGRETDTLAHKQQVLNAQLANGKARIGTELLPVVAALTGALSAALGPAINVAVAGIHNMATAGKGLYDLFVKGDFTEAMGEAFGLEEDSRAVDVMFRMRDAAIEVSGGFRAMFAAYKAGDGDVTSSGFAGTMERIGNAAREVTGGVRAMFAAFAAGDGDITSSGFAGFMEQVGGTARQVFNALLPTIQALLPTFAALVPQVFALFQALSPTSLIFQALLPVLPQIAAAVGSVLAAILPLALSLSSQLLPIITQLVSAVLPPLISIFTDVVTAIAPLITQIAGLLIPIIQALLPVVVTVFSAVASVITAAMQIVQGVIQVVTGIISGNWSQVWSGIGNIFAGIWNTIVAVVGGAIGIVSSTISNVSNAIAAAWNSFWTSVGNKVSEIWEGIKTGVSQGIETVVTYVRELPGKVLGFFSNAGTLLLSAGGSIIQGFLNGLTAGFEEVKKFVGGIGQWIADNKGPKAYDLALLIPAGGWIMDGLESGIEKSLPSLQRTLGGVSATIAAGVSGSNYSPAYTPALAGVAGSGAAAASAQGNAIERIVLDIGGEQVFARIVRNGERKLVRA